MGMFDTVYFECPKCKTNTEEQSKSGDCMLDTYSLETAPFTVVADILGPVWCENCQTRLIIEMETKPVFKVREMTQEDKDEWGE